MVAGLEVDVGPPAEALIPDCADAVGGADRRDGARPAIGEESAKTGLAHQREVVGQGLSEILDIQVVVRGEHGHQVTPPALEDDRLRHAIRGYVRTVRRFHARPAGFVGHAVPRELPVRDVLLQPVGDRHDNLLSWRSIPTVHRRATARAAC